MKIKTTVWQQGITDSIYRSGQQENEDQNEVQAEIFDDTKDAKSFSAIGAQDTPSSGSNKIKASVPDDQVGQLASLLASSETKFDVQQVSSKAMRALANLRMSGALCEGEDKEKVTQMIRRMEKLLKRVRIKMRNLTKEEQLENRQKRAEERKREQEARNLKNELRNKRNKRHKEEWDYALKEAAGGDQDTAANSLLPNGSAGMPSLSAGADITAPVAAEAAVSVDAGAALAVESVSLDVTV